MRFLNLSANNDCQDLGCEHFCDLDNDGSVVCGCPEEFALDTNGKNCYGELPLNSLNVMWGFDLLEE